MNGHLSENRKNINYLVVQIFVLVFFVVLFGRLFQLQVIDHEIYNPISERNSIRQETVNPSRGLIFDRDGNLLVTNDPSFTIMITPQNFNRMQIPLLARLTGIDEDFITERADAAQRFSRHRPSRLLIDVSLEAFSNIQENIWQLPGIDYLVEGKRSYPSGARIAHSVGFLAEITREELRNNPAYRMGDQIGRSGIERRYEEVLRGNNGTRFVTINAFGRAVGSYNDGLLDVTPEKGADLRTTIDLNLQLLAEELMVGKTGGLVVLDAKTGGIKAIVSAPDFELDRLSGRVDRAYWQQLNSDPSTPMFHRAIAASQPPGSTLKPLMGIIGLESGLITEHTVIYCPGGYHRGRFYRCLRQHGNQTIAQAIETSCNTFFYALMDRFVNRFGLNRWTRMLNSFGLGVANDLDMTGERAGIIPDSSYYNRVFGVRRWGLGDLINLGIGQGAMGTTPLQMAVSTAAIANGGHLVRPHLVSAVSEDGKTWHPTFTEPEPITWVKYQHLQTVRRGMRKAVSDGSGRHYVQLRDVNISGKTGTAQNPHGQNHGWFISYAPEEDPEIVIAVLLENAGFGSISAAPIAGLLYEQYFYGEVRRKHVKQMMLNFVPAPFNPNQ